MENKKLSSSDKKIKSISVELFLLQASFNRQKQNYEERRKELQGEIKKYLKTKNINSFNFDSSNGSFKVTDVVQKKIIFDVEKLEKRLDREILNEVVEKEYKISDWDNLVKYLKSCGVNPKKFATFLTVEKTVNQSKMNELSKLGEITPEDIEGCYEVKENEGYIKISEIENAKHEE